jgi:quinol monooxygenase YgiN
MLEESGATPSFICANQIKIMQHILAQIRIGDYDQFMAVFTTRGKEARQRHGCTRAQVFLTGEPNQVTVLFSWNSRAAFEGFLSDPAVKETMKASGTAGPPSFTFLEEAAVLPG